MPSAQSRSSGRRRVGRTLRPRWDRRRRVSAAYDDAERAPV